MLKIFKTLKLVILISILLIPLSIFAAVMQSSSYKIQSDSLNIGGGFSTSSNYRQESTVGEVGTGFSSSTNYRLSAGYQALQTNYISVSNTVNISLPNINGISGGSVQAQSDWIVVTDDPAGYQLSIVASTTPALKSTSTSASITDYAPAGAAPDFLFSVGAASSTFGFSPHGSDVISRYRNNGSACNTGSTDTTDRCWDGMSTSPKTIALGTTNNHPNGATTSVKYQVGIGSNKIQEAGSYQASVTV